MAADGDCTGHPAAATVTTRVKETTQGKQASTDLYKFPDIQIYPDQWLDDIPPISQEAMADDQETFENLDMAESAAIKLQQQSPTEGNVFSCSRTSSINSVHGISSSASSAHNTDDEDLDDIKQTMTVQDRRREAHTAAEQKRRNAIKRGYDELQNLVPTCQQQDGVGVQKLSRAAVLQKSVDYVQYLMQQKKKQEGELEDLRKEVMALEIMKANYEHLVKTHKNTPQQGQNQVSDEVKFQVLQEVMDSMFQSFNASISVANFAELSGSIFSWLEEHCKPQTLREVTLGILRQLNNQLNQ